MKTCGLKYPPIKYSIPTHVFYHQGVSRHEITGELIDHFIAFSTKKKDRGAKAFLQCMASTVDRDGMTDVPSVYVKNLISLPSGMGLGTSCLDFAQVYSKKKGCNGYLHLLASASYTPNRIPHIFYRKYGMNTNCATTNKDLDKLIAKGKIANYRDFSNIDMYYPPIKNPTTPWQKVLMFFGIEIN